MNNTTKNKPPPKKESPIKRGLFTLLILFVLLPVFKTSQAQLYQVMQYTDQNGLQDNRVWDIMQDNSGRMWFATRSGVSVYDGINWLHYTESEGLCAGEPQKIILDPYGNIHTISFIYKNRICISTFSNNKWVTTTAGDDAVFKSWVRSFIVDTLDGQNIVFAAELDASALLFYNNRWKYIDFNKQFKSKYIYSVVKKGREFIAATDIGIFYIDANGLIRKETIKTPSAVIGLYYDKNDGKLYAAGQTWFGYIENNAVTTLTDNLTGIYQYVSPYLDIIPDGKRGFIIGNWYTTNYYSFRDSSIKPVGMINGLISDIMYSALTDRENNIWISCSRGISKIYGRKFQNFENVFFYYEKEVSALLEYRPGKVLFGGNYGFSFYQEDPVTRIPLFDSPEEPKGYTRVLDMCMDNDGNIWAAANEKGLRKIDKNYKETNYTDVFNIPGLVTSVVHDGSNLWIATNYAVYVYNNEGFSKLSFFRDKTFYIRKLTLSKNKQTVYASTVDGGLLLINKENVKRILNNGRIPENNTYTAYENSDGTVYVGTEAGLCFITGDTLKRAQLNGQEIKIPVYLIVKDKKNNFWFGTNNGVYKYDGINLRNFTEKDGLAGHEVNRGAGLTDAYGRVWIGTNRGASCYYEEYDDTTLTAKGPEINITKITAGGKNYAPNEEHVFGNDQNDVRFKLFGVSFINEKENTLHYKLEGYDTKWGEEKYTNSDELIFDKLPPGEYRLMVKLSNANGVTGPVASTPVFRISRPYYQRWWFYGFILLAIGAVVYSVQRYSTQKRYNKHLKQAVDKVTAELTESETRYREALLQEVHHRVKNNLQIVSSLLSMQAQATDDKTAQSIIKESEGRIHTMALIHEKLYKTRNLSIINVSEYIKEVVDYLKRSYLFNTSLIDVKYSIPETEINADAATTLGLIVNELVTNSFKHAFSGERRGEITISLKRSENGSLALRVSDNGRGLAIPYDKDSVNTLGLKVVEILSRQHNGTFNIYNSNGAVADVTIKENAQ